MMCLLLIWLKERIFKKSRLVKNLELVEITFRHKDEPTIYNSNKAAKEELVSLDLASENCATKCTSKVAQKKRLG